jgi:hypothetical protein
MMDAAAMAGDGVVAGVSRGVGESAREGGGALCRGQRQGALALMPARAEGGRLASV